MPQSGGQTDASWSGPQSLKRRALLVGFAILISPQRLWLFMSIVVGYSPRRA